MLTLKVSSCLDPVRDTDLFCLGHFQSSFSSFVQQLFLNRYHGDICASSVLRLELGLEMSSPVTSDASPPYSCCLRERLCLRFLRASPAPSSFLLICWMSRASFPLPVISSLYFSLLVHVGKHPRQPAASVVSGRFVSPSLSCRVCALSVFISVSELSLTQPVSPLAPCQPVILSACQPSRPKV